MKLPVWTLTAFYGALVGAIFASIIGFTWGGWTTDRSAKMMAEQYASEQVTLAMVPFCLEMSDIDPNKLFKLAQVQKATGFTRRKLMMDSGWATPPGADAPSSALADACIAGLKIDES